MLIKIRRRKVDDMTHSPFAENMVLQVEDSSLEEIWSAGSALVLYFQYLGVILVETVDFGRWGEIFNFLKYFTAFYQFEEVSNTRWVVASILFVIAFFPIFVILNIKMLALLAINTHYTQLYYMDLLSLLALFIAMMTFLGFGLKQILNGETDIGVGLFILSAYLFVGVAGCSGIIKMWKGQVRVIVFLRSILVVLYVPYASLLASFWISSKYVAGDEDSRFSNNGCWVLLITFVYMLAFEFQFLHALTDKGKFGNRAKVDKSYAKYITCIAFNSKTECTGLRVMFRGSIKKYELWFQVLFFFERIIMALIGEVLGSIDFQENTVVLDFVSEEVKPNLPLIGFALVLGISTIALLLVRPFRNFRSNALQIIPRVSHLLLVLFVLFRDRIEERRLELYLICLVSLPTFLALIIFCNPLRASREFSNHIDDIGRCCNVLRRKNTVSRMRTTYKYSSGFTKEHRVVRKMNESLWNELEFTLRVGFFDFKQHSNKPDQVYQIQDDTYDPKDWNESLKKHGLSCLGEIKTLKLTENVPDFLKYVKDEEMNTFFNHLEQVKRLEVCTNQAGVNMRKVVTLLRDRPQLIEVKLKFVEVFRNFVPPLCALIREENCRLLSLDLSGNNLKAKDISAILRHIGKNKSIEHLNLSYNNKKWAKLKPKAIAGIAKNKTLVTLVLRNNFLRDKTVCEIVRSIETHPTLIKLDVTNQGRSSQNFSNETCHAMLIAQTSNQSLELYTKQEFLTQKSQRHIKRMSKIQSKRDTIQEVNLVENFG